MISVSKAKEIRARDKKRNRVLLKIGARSWHLTQDEVRFLVAALAKQIKE